MAVSNANDVAKFLISRFQEAGDPLTNMKLQKLLYYAQGWHLALKGEALFDERIEAWPHGPVVPPVYGTFKRYQWSPIIDAVEVPALSEETASHLREVMDVYGVHGAYYLEKLSHQESPWLDARRGLGPTEFCNNIISHEAMREFFTRQQ
jgi:uncharacterized phage-associated protein